MEIKKIDGYTWEIPKQGGMKVPARIYATEKLIEKIKLDRTLQQAKRHHGNFIHLRLIGKHNA